jgi:uncharacterized protein
MRSRVTALQAYPRCGAAGSCKLQELMYSAAHLTRRFPLKGYDSMHLAAADRCQRQNGMRSLTFACFDDRLNKAAAELGMQLMKGA